MVSKINFFSPIPQRYILPSKEKPRTSVQETKTNHVSSAIFNSNPTSLKKGHECPPRREKNDCTSSPKEQFIQSMHCHK